MRCAVTGSFDPITIGHIDIVKRASEMYDEVFVVVLNNESKDYMFNMRDRELIVKKSLEDIANVTVMRYDGYVIDFCREYSIDVVVRGFRNAKDYAYETQMSRWNKEHGDVDTLLLPQNNLEYINISSTLAREALSNDELAHKYMSDKTIRIIKEIAEDGK